MIQIKFMKRALAAAVAAVCGLVVFSGCSREEPPSNSPESYMKDEAFMNTLKAEKKNEGELLSAHRKLVGRMAELIEETKKKLKTEDLEKVRLALEKTEEWKSLYRRCQDAATALKEKRKKIEDIVRKRISK